MEQQTQQYIGIYLGTNFCSCAYFDLATHVPSMITIDKEIKMASWINMYGLKNKDKSCWIGNEAKDSEFTQYALYDSKRIIGREPQEVEDKKSWPFKVNKKGNSLVMVTENPLNGEKIELLPEQVTAILLKKIFSIAKRTRGTHIGNVVIAVPAQFNNRQREATLKAAKIARIKVKSLINEPVAALLAYKSSFPNDFANVKYSVVFDFGGGTLDVAVCKNEDDDRIDVVNCGGDQNLGGNNFDLVLINIIKERILEMYPEGAKYFEKQNGDTGKDERQRKQVLGRVKKAAEKVIIELSEKTMARIPLDNIFRGILKQEDIDDIGEITILREDDFEEGCQELFERCEDCLNSTIIQSGLSKRNINKVVLVGRSTKIPKVRQMIANYFNNENILSNNKFDSLTAIAKGAAIYARHCDRILKKTHSILVFHTQLELKLTNDFFKIINKDSKVPVKQTVTLPLNGGVKKLRINIYQGESKYLESPDMQFVKSLILKNNSQYPQPCIVRITFTFSERGILEATAEDLYDENSKASVSVDMKNFQCDEEIEKYRKEIQEIKHINL